MHSPTNLDDYLAGLGISDADDTTPGPGPLTAGPLAAGPLTAADAGPPSGRLAAAPGASPIPGALAPQGGLVSPEAALEEFLLGVARRFGPGLDVRVSRDGEMLSGEIVGEEVGRLIGREGHVIEALDTLAYAAVAKYIPGGEQLRVHIDVGGYRDRHFQMLQQIAGRVAQTVASSGESHTFQPMHPADRRIIHMTLKDNPHVVTQSVGEGQGRRLVVKPAPAH